MSTRRRSRARFADPGLRQRHRVKRQLRQRDALVHRRQALRVDDLEAPLPVQVLEVKVGDKRPRQRRDDDAVSDAMSLDNGVRPS